MKSICNYIMYACAMAFAGCSGADDAEELTQERNPGMVGTEVAFTTDADMFTRATTGTIDDLDALKAAGEGFGVFAYLTEHTPWASAGATATPDFMMNQQVTWRVQYVTKDNSGNDVGVKDWIYAPLKYWPNGGAGALTPGDDNDAAGVADNRYISFFAYAPYVEGREQTSGVTNYARGEDKSPHVWYTLNDIPANQTDLLYANCIDAVRKGNGLIEVDRGQQTFTYERVPLSFKHALACVEVYVQRVYDEQAYSGKTPDLPDVDPKPVTKIFVSELKLKAAVSSTSVDDDNDDATPAVPAVATRGRLNLATGGWDGLESVAGNEALTYGERLIVEPLRGTKSNPPELAVISELDRWKLNDYGVDEAERPLLASNAVLMFIPQTLTLVPQLRYSMVTRDNSLLLNTDLQDAEGNSYSRIVNTLDANPVTVSFEAGKRYKLLLRIGVERISCEVVKGIDWDFPMRFIPQVAGDFTDETFNVKIDEE